MIFCIETLRNQKETTEGFVKNDAVACYILDKSEGSFYLLSVNRCVLFHLNFVAKSPFPTEPRQTTDKLEKELEKICNKYGYTITIIIIN